MKKFSKKLGAMIMSAVMALTFTPSGVLAEGADDEFESVPVYGLYNPNSGEHYFTVDESETENLLQVGWEEGDVKWFAPASGDPVYCLYNPNVFDAAGNALGDHHYTSSETERDSLLAVGWLEGDVKFYSAPENSNPIYGVYNPNAYSMYMSGAHHLTQDASEVKDLLALGWEEGNPKFYGYAVVPVVGAGKILNVQVFNEDFIHRMENYYPGYIKTSATSGMIGDVAVNFTITPTEDNAYQDNLDELLQNNAEADAYDKVDLFIVEADYAQKYVDADKNVAIKLSDLGITSDDLSDQYKYTQEIVTDKNGDIRASSWTANSGGLIYNREIAKEIIGSDDPADVQAAVSDWSKYNETAKAAGDKGYLMTATANDTYRVYSNNVSVPWVKDNKVTIDANIERWVKDSKAQVDARQTSTGDMWGYDWYEGLKASGKVFCYFGPEWFINNIMGNAPGSDKGDDGSIAYQGGWGFCEGPQAYYWGGYYLCAANGTDDPDLVKDIIMTMTTDTEVLMEMAIKDSDCVNSKYVLAELASSDVYDNKILGGQNPFMIFAENAERIDMSNITPYDQVINEAFREDMMNYISGNASYDSAIQMFQTEVEAHFPNLTF